MTEFTLEQKRVIAIASARNRLQQQPEQVVQAPGSEPLDYKQTMKDSLGGVLKGFMTGGPMGGMMSANTEAWKNLNKLIERGGYQAGGAVTDALAPHVSPETAAKVGFAANVGTQFAPSLIGGLVSKSIGKPAMEGLGKHFMRSALKPSKQDVLSGDADKAIKTIFDEGVGVSVDSAAKLQGRVDELSKGVKKLIGGSSATVNKSLPANEIIGVYKKFRNQVNPSGDLASVSKVWDEFNRTVPNSIPIQKAQDLKQGTQQILRDSYGKLSGAEESAQKALARGLRLEIEKLAPGVAPLNKRSSDLQNAIDIMEGRTAVSGNHNILGLAPAAMNPKAAMLMLADRNPYVMSALARLLYKGSSKYQIPFGLGASVGAMYGAEKAKKD